MRWPSKDPADYSPGAPRRPDAAARPGVASRIFSLLVLIVAVVNLNVLLDGHTAVAALLSVVALTGGAVLIVRDLRRARHA